jgi:hypothetical protein
MLAIMENDAVGNGFAIFINVVGIFIFSSANVSVVAES